MLAREATALSQAGSDPLLELSRCTKSCSPGTWRQTRGILLERGGLCTLYCGHDSRPFRCSWMCVSRMRALNLENWQRPTCSVRQVTKDLNKAWRPPAGGRPRSPGSRAYRIVRGAL